jgi:hypothetical protein
MSEERCATIIRNISIVLKQLMYLESLRSELEGFRHLSPPLYAPELSKAQEEFDSVLYKTTWATWDKFEALLKEAFKVCR